MVHEGEAGLRRCLFFFALALAPAAAASAEELTAEQALDNARALYASSGCAATSPSPLSNEIVVCGRNREREAARNRLPLPRERDPAALFERREGDVPNGSAERLAGAPCGIFEGQRRCSKAEMRASGYGGGRDPVSLLAGLATLAVDPDADIAD